MKIPDAVNKRTPVEKAKVRERRNRMLESAAEAKLSLTEGVLEMRAIAGMTQEEFAKHRGVSARVIKAIELGQANPTVATLNRIGQFFGLEVAFAPIKRSAVAELQTATNIATPPSVQTNDDMTPSDFVEAIKQARASMHSLNEALAKLGDGTELADQLYRSMKINSKLFTLPETEAKTSDTKKPRPG